MKCITCLTVSQVGCLKRIENIQCVDHETGNCCVNSNKVAIEETNASFSNAIDDVINSESWYL